MVAVAPGPAALVFFALLLLFMLPSNYPANQSKVFEYINTQLENVYTLKNATVLSNDDGQETKVNLTGINWPLVPEIVEKDGIELWNSGIISKSDEGSYTLYSNITSILSSGSWQLQDFIEPHHETRLEKNLSSPFDIQLTHNISGEWDGSASLYLTRSSLQQRAATSLWDTKKVQLLDANLQILGADDETIVGLEMNGVHLVDEGRIILSTSSKEYCGFGALPFLIAPMGFYTNNYDREVAFNLTRDAVVGGLEEHIKDIQQSYDGDLLLSNSEYDGAESTMRRKLYIPCEYIIYGQVKPIHMTPLEANILEEELRNPIGRPYKKPIPSIQVNFIGYSTNCGSRFKGKANGDKIEIYWEKIHKFGLISTILCILQIYLSMDQISRIDTPSNLCRVSIWTIGIMTLNDGIFCLAFLTSAIYIEPTFLIYMSGVFFFFLLVSAFEMRFLMSIYEAQFPERQAAAATAAAAAAAAQQQQQQQQQQELPIPASAVPAPAPAPPPETMSVSKIYTTYCMTLGGTIILILNSFSWTTSMRNILINILILSSNSFLIPQIYRNTIRGTRKSFTFYYVICTSIIRIMPGFYLYFSKENIFSYNLSTRWFFILFGFVWIQIIIIKSQQVLGPRWFIPIQLLPKTYDYHKKINYDQEEQTIGDGDDCVICMQPLNLHLNNGNNKLFMQTPCNHIFHTPCLESWMRYRLQCPICRSTLPPI